MECVAKSIRHHTENIQAACELAACMSMPVIYSHYSTYRRSMNPDKYKGNDTVMACSEYTNIKNTSIITEVLTRYKNFDYTYSLPGVVAGTKMTAHSLLSTASGIFSADTKLKPMAVSIVYNSKKLDIEISNSQCVLLYNACLDIANTIYKFIDEFKSIDTEKALETFDGSCCIIRYDVLRALKNMAEVATIRELTFSGLIIRVFKECISLYSISSGRIEIKSISNYVAACVENTCPELVSSIYNIKINEISDMMGYDMGTIKPSNHDYRPVMSTLKRMLSDDPVLSYHLMNYAKPIMALIQSHS